MFQWHRPLCSRYDIDIFLLRSPVSVVLAFTYETKMKMADPTQSANSRVFGTVADRRIMFTWSGSMIMTSSQTTPRCGCFMYGPHSACTRAHLCIIDIVNFVEYDEFYISNQICSFVQHTTENFSCHHEARSFRIYLHISGEDAD